MPAKRVHMTLNILAPGGFPFQEEELVGFLQDLAMEGKIEKAGHLWKIKRN